VAKEYFVLRGGRVVYPPGHNDLDGARATARAELAAHPKSEVTIVQIVEALQGPSKK
jgi:hypothetical protein